MDKLILYFQYPFVRYAMIVGVLIAMCSSLLGVTLVLKRFSFIGDGLSHVAFGAMAVAGYDCVCDSVVKNRAEYKNQRRCGSCHDIGKCAGNRIHADEYIFNRTERVR